VSEYLSGIGAVIFDHDDTLVGSYKAKWAQHKHVAQTWYNKELTDDEIRQHWGKPFRTLIRLLYETEDLDTAFRRMMAVHKAYPKLLLPETIPTLQSVHDSGRLIGVVTATMRFSFEHDLDELGIPRNLLDYTQTEDETEHHKPDKRVFDPAKSWLRAMGVNDSEVLYVGDGLHDYAAASGAGFRFLGVETGLVNQLQFIDAGAVCVSSLGKLL